MAEFTLPKNSKIKAGKRVDAAAKDAKRKKTFKVYRYDPDTGEKTIRKRKAGEVIFHSRGEIAPQLTNVGKTPLRSLEIALKSAN